LIVYNRSPDGIKGFRIYAAEHDVPDEAFTVVQDLREIGRRCVSYCDPHHPDLKLMRR